MDAIITPSTTSLVNRVKKDNPNYQFVLADDFVWSPTENTIYYAEVARIEALWALVHELAHARLGHIDFQTDIQLVSKEAEAWQFAKLTLGPTYGLVITDTYIEDQLDSYRDWLHQRSLCPTCHQTGLQTQTHHYSCINCGGVWRVNDARRCSLRRYVVA